MTILTLQPDESSGKDTFISAGHGDPAYNYGVATYLETAGPASTARILIRFDLSSIPVGSVISSAVLSLYSVSEGSSLAVTVQRALTDWFEGNGNQSYPSTNGSTWSKRDSFAALNWGSNTPGGLAGTDFSNTIISTVNVAGGGWWNWPMTAEVNEMVNLGVTNRGWWMLQASGAVKQYISSSNAGTTLRPKLVIEYYDPSVSAPAATSAVAGSASPVVVKGSATSEPSPTNSVGATAGPEVFSGQTLSASPPAESGSDTVVGSILIGGETILGAVASASGSSENGPPSLRLQAPPSAAVGKTETPLSVKGSVVFVPNPAEAIGSTESPASLIDRTLRPTAATVVGSTVGKGKALRIYPVICTPDPILHITDGTVKNNGQHNLLDLLGRVGFLLNNWNPNIAQYKSGGVWSDSVLADGRYLARKSYGNGLEVMDMRGRGHNQDNMIEFIRDLFYWQERAADFWVSDWATRPVFLAAKAARETEIRYAIIHAISVPELSNPYSQPFFDKRGTAALDALTLRIERGPWTSTPPGEGECAPVSGVRSWTIQGWSAGDTEVPDNEITGSITALVQTTTGDILAGTDTSGRVYRSGDSGQTWFYLSRIGNDPISNVSIRAFAKDNTGNIFAAVDGGHALSQGIWKSTNHGVSWTRVKSHAPGTGYLDITAAQGRRLVAVGHPVGSGADSPIVVSDDYGATWQNVSTPHWNQKFMSVASYPEVLLFTQYPGELYGSVSTFYGTDSYYTMMGGVGGYPPGNFGFGTLGGGAGNGGLDMVSFLVSNGAGGFYRRALWAVKSHLDVTDTEIWQWPGGTYQSGSTQLTKIATIDSKLFNVMYVDPPVPNWQGIGAARTIWAGANGEIYVSYNSGLSWALATDAPVNQIRSLLRTTSGVLLAGGDNGEIFVYTGDSGSQGGGTSTGAPAGGSIVVNSHSLGREETCDDEVFASNKSSFNNLTHVLHYNGSTYSELQFATLPPYALLGATAGVNKAAYFGSKTSDINVPGGTFSSIIFDIGQIAENLTVVWEYYNGAWSALTVQDSSDRFKIPGVGSVHWIVPGDWTTLAVNGITGYWIRARISAVGSDPVTPIHENRFIYTANLPYVELAESAVGGDLPAAAQIRWHNRSDDIGSLLGLEVDRIVCGLRSANRGPNFNAYLNISDEQIPFGVSIAKDALGTWADSARAPTNRSLLITYASGGSLNVWNDLAVFSIDTTVARDYYGTYRAFVRCWKYGAGTQNWQLRLRTSFGSGGSQAMTKSIFPTTGNDWEILDFGQVSIPTTQISFLGNNLGDKLEIAVQGYATATGVGIVLYDLILIPTDEWAVDSRSPELSTADTAKIKGSSMLDIDSVTNPKTMITATNRTSADLIVARYQAVTNGPAILQTKQQQRMWFLAMSYENFWSSPPEVAGTVQIFKQQRYLGPRGTS